MEIYLDIITGNLAGKRIELKDGLTVGRLSCDITLQDSKVSQKHARIEERNDGFWIVDLDSANGIRVGPSKVREMKLDPGIAFRLGKTELKISAGEEALIGLMTPEIVVEDTRSISMAAAPMLEVKNARVEKKPASAPTTNDPSARLKAIGAPTWADQLRDLAERGIREGEFPEPRKLFAFPDVIGFRFKSGVQTGTEWTVGYGPRMFGSSSLDLCFEERGIPAMCFEIQPHQEGVLLLVVESARGKVLLNGRKADRAFLKTGDVIQIGETQIEVGIAAQTRIG